MARAQSSKQSNSGNLRYSTSSWRRFARSRRGPSFGRRPISAYRRLVRSSMDASLASNTRLRRTGTVSPCVPAYIACCCIGDASVHHLPSTRSHHLSDPDFGMRTPPLGECNPLVPATGIRMASRGLFILDPYEGFAPDWDSFKPSKCGVGPTKGGRNHARAVGHWPRSWPGGASYEMTFESHFDGVEGGKIRAHARSAATPERVAAFGMRPTNRRTAQRDPTGRPSVRRAGRGERSVLGGRGSVTHHANGALRGL